MTIAKKLNTNFFESIRHILRDTRQKPYTNDNFRQFYLTYSDFEKCYTLCSKSTWHPHQQNLESQHVLETFIPEGDNHE